MNEEKKKLLRNHIPHARGYLNNFLMCLDVNVKEEPEKEYLLEMLSEAKKLIKQAKDIIEVE